MEVKIDRFRRVDLGAFLAACTVSLVSKTGEAVLDISSVRVMDGREGRWVALPAEKGKDNKYYPIVTIKHKALKTAIDRAVLGEYERRTTRPAVGPASQVSTDVPEPASADGPSCFAG